ncbi:hypothetical protein RCC94_03200 [Exiguobacterium acetylicum]|uniref:hypothetical protein n=1 Tax=Exiguobacterium TaxID=33986 RepID=UPI0012E2192B|nr:MULTISPECIES: hypothetical protein [Exiguobacterium]MDQ6466476.1 hypothetical protein [Exiguobacterium acetylicum]
MLHMLTWLGVKADKKAERQFFAGVEKKTIFLILLLALAILKGVKWGMTVLIPTAFFSDPIVSVLPGVLGVLTAVVFVLLVERFLQDKSSEK